MLRRIEKLTQRSYVEKGYSRSSVTEEPRRTSGEALTRHTNNIPRIQSLPLVLWAEIIRRLYVSKGVDNGWSRPTLSRFVARKNTRALSTVPAKVALGIISSAGALLAPNQSPGLGSETLRL